MRYKLLFLQIFIVAHIVAQTSIETSAPNAMGCTGNTAFPDLPGWEHEQITIPDSYNRSWSPHFINLKTGFLLGATGPFLRTGDGGRTWEKIDAPSGLNFNSLFFSDSLHGFAGAHRSPAKGDSTITGRLLRTGDGGRTWSEAPYHMEGVPQSLHFFDLKHGLAIFHRSFKNASAWKTEGFVARTADGGATWSRIAALEPAMTASNSLKFKTPKFGYFAGAPGKIYKTVDGGKSWTTAETGLDQILSLQFLDAKNAYAYGHHKLLKTIDGGASWSLVTDRMVDFFHFFTPSEGISIQTLEICGYENNVVLDNAFLITHDGGTTWINGDLSRNFSLKRIFFLDANHAFSSMGSRPGVFVRLKRK